jgi:hypothetical protein
LTKIVSIFIRYSFSPKTVKVLESKGDGYDEMSASFAADMKGIFFRFYAEREGCEDIY